MGDIANERKLFTPGPLGCSEEVKTHMLRDIGSREPEFIACVAEIRQQLLDVAGVAAEEWVCILLQGSGTYCVEASLQTATPRNNDKVLVLANGAYGRRMRDMCEIAELPHIYLEGEEHLPMSVDKVEETLKESGGGITTVSMVHHETSSGVLNPAAEIGKLVKKYTKDALFILDAMSSFGAVPLDLASSHVDIVVSSANKCLQGVPGFSFAIMKRSLLSRCKGNCRALSLDLVSQLAGLEKNGQFRFTPPTHSILAFKAALEEYKREGGLPARAKRYEQNNQVLLSGMLEMGFKLLVDEKHRGYIISSFFYPSHDNFNFEDFYLKLYAKDQVIYPGKVSQKDCFRIGNIGYLFPKDMEYLLKCIRDTLKEMEIPIPVS